MYVNKSTDLKYLAKRPVLNQLQPVIAKTGLRPQKTAVFGLLQSWSSLLHSGMKADWFWSWSLKMWPKDQTGPDFQALTVVDASVPEYFHKCTNS